MLAFRDQPGSPAALVPNILPCRLHCSGPVGVTKRFWSPTVEIDKTKTAYFRGRRLRGKMLTLPAGYIGVAAKATDLLAPHQSQFSKRESGNDESAEEDNNNENPQESPEPVKILQSVATFSKVTVWGHDMLPEADDPFVKGIDEWIALAETIHVEPSQSMFEATKTPST